MAAELHPRRVSAALEERLGEAAVVRLTGPRAAGKTTACERVISDRGGSVVRLDDPNQAAAAAADPTGFISGLTAPALIDEYQRVPTLLDAIKSDLSAHGAAPGQWLLCGSVSIAATTTAAETLGGRLSDVAMGTLTVDERNDLPAPGLIAWLLADGLIDAAPMRGWRSPAPLGREELLAEAVRGGFPLVTDRADGASRRRGLEDWVRASVIADGAAVGGVRDVESLRRMLELYASATASITPKDRPTADRIEIDRRTVASYRDLLAALHVIWDLPAFVPGHASAQVTRSPKLHLIDSGLAAMLARRDAPTSLDRDARYAGALVETACVNDLRVHVAASSAPARLFHFRDADHEVDVVIERADGSVIGVEVKLTANPGERSFRGLHRLRRSAGPRWAGGVVLCRTPVASVREDGLVVAPIEALWQFGDGGSSDRLGR